MIIPEEKKLSAFIEIAVILLLLPLYVHPNPYGNQTGVINDEGYFQTSVFLAFSHRTLPGFDFSVGGAYYGGLTTYLLAVALLPVIGITTIAKGSFVGMEIYLAEHSGDLLQLTRFVTALTVLAAAMILLKTTKNEERAELDGLLLIGLLIADPLFVALSQTGKVWTIQLLFEMAAATTVVLQEHARLAGRTQWTPSVLVAILAWCGLLASIQNPFGIATFFWLFAAWRLGHFTMRDMGLFLFKQWGLIAAALILQASFFWRFGKSLIPLGSFASPIASSFTLPDGRTDWLLQLIWPVEMLMKDAPLLLTGLASAAICILLMGKRFGAERRLTLVLAVYPLFVYLFYHVIFRFGRAPRYILPLAVACSLSLAFLPKPKRFTNVLLACAWILAIGVATKTAILYWLPSSERQVVDFFSALPADKVNDVINRTGRIELPMNRRSIANAGVDLPERLRFIAAHLTSSLDADRFTPVVLPMSATTTDESGMPDVWSIDIGCDRRCVASEKGTCIDFNVNECKHDWDFVQEGPTLRGLFMTQTLGYPYSVRTTDSTRTRAAEPLLPTGSQTRSESSSSPGR